MVFLESSFTSSGVKFKHRRLRPTTVYESPAPKGRLPLWQRTSMWKASATSYYST